MNIVFDLDGTLIDSAPDIQAVAARVLEGQGKPALTLEETRQFIGAGAAVFVQRMMAARGIIEEPSTHARLLEEFVRGYQFSVDLAQCYPGVLAVLSQLKSMGHNLGLCTNKPESATSAVLKHMSLTPFFGCVVAGDMLASRKPEPEMLLHTIAGLGQGPTLYIGDSEIDAETAQRANVPCALFSGGYRKTQLADLYHQWAFDHFDEVPDIVAQALSAQ